MAKKYDPSISPRMFQSDFLEFFSHIHPATPVVFWSPVIVAFIAISYSEFTLWALVALYCAGIALWTSLEYLLHRWVFHYEPTTAWGKRLHFLLHGVHHDYPRDSTRLVMPLGVSIPMGVILYTLLWIFGMGAHDMLFAGLASGYLAYDMIHYATHHRPMKNRLGRFLKQYHMRHHFTDSRTAYGVSNPLWDYVFGTVPGYMLTKKNNAPKQ